MQETYEDIVRKWYIRLRPAFMHCLIQRYSALTLADADDLYQDTFIAIQKNLMEGRVKENTSWSSYIIQIGMNMASKQMRHIGITDSIDSAEENVGANKTAKRAEDLLKSMPTEEHSLYDNPEADALLGQELAQMPEPCSTIVRLFYYEQRKMEEIADAIGYKNADTAKAKKNQCMKRLIERVKAAFQRAGF